MLALQRLWTVLVGAYLGAFLARLIFAWLLDLNGAWATAVILAAAALGAVLEDGAHSSETPQPLGASSRRCLGGAFAVVVTVVVLRRLGERERQHVLRAQRE